MPHWKPHLLRLLALLQRYPGLIAAFGFCSGVASFILVDRQAGLGEGDPGNRHLGRVGARAAAAAQVVMAGRHDQDARRSIIHRGSDLKGDECVTHCRASRAIGATPVTA